MRFPRACRLRDKKTHGTVLPYSISITSVDKPSQNFLLGVAVGVFPEKLLEVFFLEDKMHNATVWVSEVKGYFRMIFPWRSTGLYSLSQYFSGHISALNSNQRHDLPLTSSSQP